VNVEDLSAIAHEAATAAGRLLMEGLEAGPSHLDTKTSSTDLVSDLDRAAEKLIVEVIRSYRPDDDVLGEEGGLDGSGSTVRWVVDPLDGTVNYVYRYPAFSVSVAAELHDEVVVGVVHDPWRDETFAARRGAGATRNGHRLAVNQISDLSMALVGTGFSYDSATRQRQANVLTSVIPTVRDIRRAGSAALDLCSVAAGRLDAYFEAGTRDWDRAAGGLIAAEAGARVGDLRGGPHSEDMIVAAPAGLFDALCELLRDARADRVRSVG
jgi:myo-inositol-1(or 4)-monophosphatase